MSQENTNHILFLPRWYPHRYDPMMGLFVQRHAISVLQHNEVSVIYIHPTDGISHFEIDIQKNFGLYEIRVYYPKGKFLKKLISPINFIRSFFKAYHILLKERGKPDLSHVNILTRKGVLALWLKKTQKIPYVITEHWTRYLPQHDSYGGFLRKILTTKVVKNASAVMPVTYNLQQAMESKGLKNNNYQIVPNVVDVNLFQYDPSKRDKSIKNLIHLSCFADKPKNMTGILRTIKRLSEQRTDFKLYMVGDGVDLEMSKKYAEELGIKDNFVVFTGLKENQDLVEYMQKAEIMIMFSRFENLPVVILEGFACGMPTLSTDVGGIREHLSEDRGILIASEDEEAFLEKLQYMLNNLDRYDHQAIREYAVKMFSNEAIGNQINNIYQDILTKHG